MLYTIEGANYCEFVFLLLQIIFLLIVFIHFFWALGGKWGFNKVLPIKENGERLFTPTRIHSLIVGLIFIGMMYLIWLQAGIKGGITKPIFHPKYLLYLFALIFFLRALGEFKYVGFFKKIKHNSFAKLDTCFFSPLCFLISTLIFIFLLSDCHLSIWILCF